MNPSMIRSAAGALAATLAVAAAPIAAAQTPTIVGVWAHPVVSQNPQQTFTIYVEFDPNGQVHTRVVNSIQTLDEYGVYQVLNNGADIRMEYTDYSPKQVCTIAGCLTVQPTYPLGQFSDNQVQFNGPNVVFFGADMYTRQQ